VAKALTGNRSRRGAAPDSAERELKRLRLSVCDDVGFRLYVATYDQPKRRDELIARVTEEAKAERVRVSRLDIGESGPETNLVGLLRAHLLRTALPPGWREAVMVTGIEQRIDYSAAREGFAFPRQSNLLRDALPQTAPVPIVLWLSRLASAALPAEAPDLWDWRAANFDFTGDESPRLELLREITTSQPQADLGISSDQRRARIQMLEDLLAELEREGAPKSKRQAAERAKFLLELGIEEYHLGRVAEGAPRFERALEMVRRIGEPQAEMFVLIALGSARLDAADAHKASESYKQALVIARQIGDRRTEAKALDGLGRSSAALDELRRATKYYKQSLTIARQIGELEQEAQTVGHLGNAYSKLGEMRSAIKNYEQQLAIARKTDDRPRLAATLRDLGHAYNELGERKRAIEHYYEALATAREIGDRRVESFALGGLGLSYTALGETRHAIEVFEQALVIAREMANRRLEGIWLHCRALEFDELGDRAEARRQMEHALGIYQEIGAQDLVGEARAQLAEWQAEEVGGESEGSPSTAPGGK
jgi:tetratricopeptide (TPR) repeat protein